MFRFLRTVFQILFWAALFAVFVWFGFGGLRVIEQQDLPLPNEWNPLEPLDVKAQLGPFTNRQLAKALGDPEMCKAALQTASDFADLDDFQARQESCHIRNRVRISDVSGVTLQGTETRCDTALRLAMWLEHGVKPAAVEHLGQTVTRLRTQGSYNCRNIAGTSRPSTHSQARAIDVAGFTLADGDKVELINHWTDESAKSDFLRAVRDSSCRWFETTLGPEYNLAHADHFHFQSVGWGTCR